MHAQYSDQLSFSLQPGTPCLPHIKDPTILESAPPRSRTSMSSHSRLTSDNAACDKPFPGIEYSLSLLHKSHGNGSHGAGTRVGLMDMPEEIQQRILDMLMGELRSTSSSATDGNHALRNWNHAMRHPRGHWLANLSVVSLSWRRLIQERLYRHIKIQGTRESLKECTHWFLFHPHLSDYVRHIEFWVPVWEKRSDRSEEAEFRSTITMDMAVELTGRLNVGVQPVEPINAAYKLSSQKATLDELFNCVSYLFQYACVLTIEGGHCKKPPMIQQFRSCQTVGQKLTPLPNIRTLVMRGAWNVIREETHFYTIADALPNIREWHCTYTKPKVQGYRTIYGLLPHLPSSLTHLNICLEGFYNKKAMDIVKVRALRSEAHFCTSIGSIMPQLEAVTLTGRVCSHLFNVAIEAAKRARKTRLKSFDLVVKNCCRDTDAWNDGTGIHNSGFIAAFEQLVTSATRALKAYSELNFLRIRFVDLDTPCPLLNPYFQLQGGECAGIWNDEILENLAASRPKVSFVDISESFGARAVSKAFLSYPTRRPKSIKVSSYYAVFAEGPLL